jgi:hypothetical protein
VSVSGGARFFFSFSPPPRGGGRKEGGEREEKWWRKERNARLAGWPAGAKKQSTGARAGAADCSEKEGGAALEEIGPGSYPRLLLLEYFIVMWIEESGENSNDVLLEEDRSKEHDASLAFLLFFLFSSGRGGRQVCGIDRADAWWPAEFDAVRTYRARRLQLGNFLPRKDCSTYALRCSDQAKLVSV